MSPIPPTRDEQTVLLMRVLFHDYFAVSTDIALELRPGVLPQYFFGWLMENMPLLPDTEICAAAAVPVEAWKYVDELIHHPIGPERIRHVWHEVSMSRRPVSAHKVKNLSVVMMIEWEDGTKIPIRHNIVQIDAADDNAPADGRICKMASSAVSTFVDAFRKHTLDEMHDMGEKYGGDHPMEVIIGILIQTLKGDLLLVKEDTKQRLVFDEKVVPYISNYVRLIRTIMLPLPEGVRADQIPRLAPKIEAPPTGGFG